MQLINTSRLGRGLSAQAYSYVVTVALQFGTVPVLLWTWGAERYGVWIILAAVPTYLSLCDFGIAQAAATSMTISISQRNVQEAASTFRAAWIPLNVLSLILILTATATTLWLPLHLSFLPTSVPLDSARWALLWFSIQICLTIVFGTLTAAIRSVGKFSTAISLVSHARLTEGGVTILAALATNNLAIAAFAGMLSRALFFAITVRVAKLNAPWIQFGFRGAKFQAVRALASPSIGYMAYMTGHMLCIQGFTILLGVRVGPEAVAVFSTVRTYTRVGSTIGNALSQPLELEYSELYAAHKLASIRTLLKYQITGTLVGVAAYVATALFLADTVFKVWTHGRIDPPERLLVLLVVATGVEVLWSALLTPLISSNKHQVVAFSFLTASATAVIGTSIFPVTTEGAALALLAIGIGVACVCVWSLIRTNIAPPD